MRKVVLYQLLSLDGVAEEPGDWMTQTDQSFIDNLGRIIGSQDDVLLGRGTYDYWAEHWPSSDFEPFASFINGTTKHVATSTPLTPEWAHTTTITGPVTDYAAALKELDGGDIGIHGSIELARSLLDAHLVDELQLAVAPTVAHRGKKLFDGDAASYSLELLESPRASGGVLMLGYRVLPK
jgi:dihydrofolate reductase